MRNSADRLAIRLAYVWSKSNRAKVVPAKTAPAVHSSAAYTSALISAASASSISILWRLFGGGLDHVNERAGCDVAVLRKRLPLHFVSTRFQFRIRDLERIGFVACRELQSPLVF